MIEHVRKGGYNTDTNSCRSPSPENSILALGKRSSGVPDGSVDREGRQGHRSYTLKNGSLDSYHSQTGAL